MYGIYDCYCVYAIVCILGVVITFQIYGIYGIYNRYDRYGMDRIIDMHGRYGICSTEVVWSEYTGSKQEIDAVNT